MQELESRSARLEGLARVFAPRPRVRGVRMDAIQRVMAFEPQNPMLDAESHALRYALLEERPAKTFENNALRAAGVRRASSGTSASGVDHTSAADARDVLSKRELQLTSTPVYGTQCIATRYPGQIVSDPDSWTWFFGLHTHHSRDFQDFLLNDHSPRCVPYTATGSEAERGIAVRPGSSLDRRIRRMVQSSSSDVEGAAGGGGGGVVEGAEEEQEQDEDLGVEEGSEDDLVVADEGEPIAATGRGTARTTSESENVGDEVEEVLSGRGGPTTGEAHERWRRTMGGAGATKASGSAPRSRSRTEESDEGVLFDEELLEEPDHEPGSLSDEEPPPLDDETAIPLSDNEQQTYVETVRGIEQQLKTQLHRVNTAECLRLHEETPKHTEEILEKKRTQFPRAEKLQVSKVKFFPSPKIDTPTISSSEAGYSSKQ